MYTIQAIFKVHNVVFVAFVYREQLQRACFARYRNIQMPGRVWTGYWRPPKASSPNFLLYRCRPFAYDKTRSPLGCLFLLLLSKLWPNIRNIKLAEVAIVALFEERKWI